jgi:hypothetical protein
VQSGASVNTGTPTAIQLNAINSTLTNYGTITNSSGVSNTATVNTTVFFTQNGGSLVNYGQIVNEYPYWSGTANHFNSNDPSEAVVGNGTFSGVYNGGLIEAAASALEVNNGVTGNVINSATGQLISTQGTAVVFGTTAFPVAAVAGNFENDGLIQSAFGQGAIFVGDMGGNVTNTGTIKTIEAYAGGSCNGHVAGAGYCVTGIFIYGTVSGNLTNSGTILATSTQSVGNGVFGSGIIVDAVDGNIVNLGSITGKNGYGIAVGGPTATSSAAPPRTRRAASSPSRGA